MMTENDKKINVEDLNAAVMQILSKFGFNSAAILPKEE
jgi:hypothetical protein